MNALLTSFFLLQIFGIDASSGAAVVALDVQPRDHVLDLCAAPGKCRCWTTTGTDVANQFDFWH
jgi:hypothetical protein